MVRNPVSRIKADDGSFALTDIAPGIYALRVSGLPGELAVKSVQVGSQEVAANRIEVTEATGLGPIQITLSRAMGQIEGIVLHGPQQTPGGSSITVFAEPIGEGATILSGVPENGRFSLRVPPGTYRIYAWEDLEVAQRYDPVVLKSHEDMSVLVTVQANAVERISLREIPAAAVR